MPDRCYWYRDGPAANKGEEKMTHTPGPWDVSKVGYVMKGGAIHPPAPDETRLEGESWLDMRKRIAPEVEARKREEEANARLTAAAPLLFEALVMVAGKINPGDASGDTFADFNFDEVEQILSAINRATGQ